MKTRLTRAISIILTIAAVFAVLPMQAFAAPPRDYELYLVKSKYLECSDVTGKSIDKVLQEILGSDMSTNPDLTKAKAASDATPIGILRLADYRDGRKKLCVYEIRPGEIKINGQPYVLSKAQNKKLTEALEKAQEFAGLGTSYALWTSWFGWDQVTGMECSINSKNYEYGIGGRYVIKNKQLKADQYAWDFLKEMLIYNPVIPDSMRAYSGSIKGLLENYIECKVAIKDGTIFTIYFDIGGGMFIESNKKNYGCSYSLIYGEMYEKFLIAIASGELPYGE